MKKQASGRFSVEKLRKRLLLHMGVGRASARHARESRYPRFDDCALSTAPALRTKVFCGAFLQKSDRFLALSSS
jgi:hypothetical protein